MPPLLWRAEEGDLVVMCLHISHCLYEETEIGKYQAFNDLKQTLDLLNKARRGEILANACREIKVLALLHQDITND